VLIKILYVLFVLCTAALVAVGIGVLLRVRQHLKAGHAAEPAPADEAETIRPPGDDQTQ
jgi:hypothetical protein